ncbi:MAG: hypothetical protein QF464_20645, partial [Myxococcota bacterium]|nr:hypothetical protein [Myxococcota bacterium]
AYDETGRIETTTTPEGRVRSYETSSEVTGTQFVRTEPDGSIVEWNVEKLPTGGRRSVVGIPNGNQTTTTSSADGLTVNMVGAAGSEVTVSYAYDPLDGTKYLSRTELKTPAGLTQVSETQRTYEFGETAESCSQDCAEVGTDCCGPHGEQGCGDADCQASVCESTPTCCETEWTDACADAALELCAICGGSGPSCGDGICQAGDKYTETRLANGEFVTSHTSDMSTRTLTTELADGTSDVTTLDPIYDRATQIQGPGVFPITFTYSDGGLLTQVEQGDRVQQWFHDARGNIIERIAPNGLSYLAEYDALGRKTRGITPDGGVTEYTHNNGDEYAPHGRLTELIRPNGSVVSFQYGEDQLLSDMSPVVDMTFSYEYDDSGRLTKTTFPSGATKLLTWDRSKLVSWSYEGFEGAGPATALFTEYG